MMRSRALLMAALPSPAATAKNFKLTYFDFHARGEALRLAFAVGGLEFEDERISRPTWAKMKASGAAPFNQLPLLTFEANGTELTVAQSGAILRYVGRLTGLYPTDALEALHVDAAIDYIEEFQPPIMATIFPARYAHEDFPDEAAKMAARARLAAEILPARLAMAEALLEANGTGWVCGDDVTVADLKWYSQFARLAEGDLDGVPADLLDAYPKCRALVDKVEAIPSVHAWQEAERAAKKG